MFPTLVPLLVPVVTAVIGAIGLMLKDRRLAHDSRAIREHALTQASSQIAFATDWWKAQQLLGHDHAAEADQKLRAWLIEAESTVAVAEANPVSADHHPVTIRRLLLLEPMHRRSSRVLRVLFWLSAAWLLIAAAVTAGDANSQPGWISDDVAGMILFAVITLLLHVWAEASDHHRLSSGSSRSSEASAVPVATSVPMPPGAALPRSYFPRK